MNQKTSFTKVAKFGMPFENISIKVKVMLSFGHKAVISSVSKLTYNQKTSSTKVAQFGMLLENMA